MSNLIKFLRNLYLFHGILYENILIGFGTIECFTVKTGVIDFWVRYTWKYESK